MTDTPFDRATAKVLMMTFCRNANNIDTAVIALSATLDPPELSRVKRAFGGVLGEYCDALVDPILRRFPDLQSEVAGELAAETDLESR